jgi:hypothetical protein
MDTLSLIQPTLLCALVAVLICLKAVAQPRETVTTYSSEAPAQRKDVRSVLGTEVRTDSERNVGRVIDLLASPQGTVEAAVIEFGGFLGVGSRKIAVEWAALRVDIEGRKLVVILDIPREQLRGAPDYKPDQPQVVRKAVEPSTVEQADEVETCCVAAIPSAL